MFGRAALLCLMFVTGDLVASLAAWGADTAEQEGVVVTAEKGKLVIADKKGKQHTYTIDASTKVTVHGKPGKLEDLEASTPVRVMTGPDNKVLSVSTVDSTKLCTESVALGEFRPQAIPDGRAPWLPFHEAVHWP